MVPFAAALDRRTWLTWSPQVTLPAIAAISAALVLSGYFARTGTDPLRSSVSEGAAAFPPRSSRAKRAGWSKCSSRAAGPRALLARDSTSPHRLVALAVLSRMS